jgi:two-component system, NtrC family, response regulator HydG
MQKSPAKILVVDDDPDILTAARVVLRQKFETVVTEQHLSRIESLLRQQVFDVILLDMNFAAGVSSGNEGLYWLRHILSQNSNQPVILITAYSDIQLAVEGIKSGAVDFIVKPWSNEQLIKKVFQAMEKTGKNNNTERVKSVTTQGEIIGVSHAIRTVLDQIQKVASTEANVLLTGENGTGKELFAMRIHELSTRRDRPFVKIDLGAVVPTLFESELFGHVKGSFTDARDDKPGKFELADGGTLFLDEIGNLPLPLQPKLLSVLQSRSFMRVGALAARPIDVRLICATNLDLLMAVERSQFRQDLLYRINTIEINVPALRDRPEDIPSLVTYFLNQFSSVYGKQVLSVSDEALKKLQGYSWPGNIRELSHAVERAIIMSNSETLEKDDFVFKRSTAPSTEGQRIDELERNAIILALARHNGNRLKVAKELGLGRTTLYRKMEKYGIEKKIDDL